MCKYALVAWGAASSTQHLFTLNSITCRAGSKHLLASPSQWWSVGHSPHAQEICYSTWHLPKALNICHVHRFMHARRTADGSAIMTPFERAAKSEFTIANSKICPDAALPGTDPGGVGISGTIPCLMNSQRNSFIELVYRLINKPIVELILLARHKRFPVQHCQEQRL